MPSLDSWLAASIPSAIPIASASERAVLAWRRIQDRPTTITKKGGSAQVVRVEYHDLSHEEDGPANTAGVSQATIFGVRNHPTVADTALAKGDRITIANVIFEVIAVMLPPGEVQALCEMRGG